MNPPAPPAPDHIAIAAQRIAAHRLIVRAADRPLDHDEAEEAIDLVRDLEDDASLLAWYSADCTARSGDLVRLASDLRAVLKSR